MADQVAEPLLDAALMGKLERLTLVTRRAFVGQMKGEKRSLRRGASVEFADYREYLPGDDLRYVDWNTAARLDRLFVKLFIEEEDLFLSLIVDTSKSMDFGEPTKLRLAAGLAAALGYVALSGFDRVALNAFAAGLGREHPVQRGRAAVPGFLSYVGALRAEGGTSFARAMRSFAARTRSRGIAVVLSDLMDPEWREGLRSLLGRGFQVAILHTLSTEELEPTLVGDLRIIDAESGDSRELSISPALLSRYRAAVANHCDEVRAFARRYGADYLRVTTADSVEAVMLGALRRDGVVR